MFDLLATWPNFATWLISSTGCRVDHRTKSLPTTLDVEDIRAEKLNECKFFKAQLTFVLINTLESGKIMVMTEQPFRYDEIKTEIASSDLLKFTSEIKSGTRSAHMTLEEALVVMEDLTGDIGKDKNFSDLDEEIKSTIAKIANFSDEVAYNFIQDALINRIPFPDQETKQTAINSAKKLRKKISDYVKLLQGAEDYLSFDDRLRMGLAEDKSKVEPQAKKKIEDDALSGDQGIYSELGSSEEKKKIEEAEEYLNISKLIVGSSENLGRNDVKEIIHSAKSLMDALEEQKFSVDNIPQEYKEQVAATLNYIFNFQKRIQDRLLDISDFEIRKKPLDPFLSKKILQAERANQEDEIFIERKNYKKAKDLLLFLHELFQNVVKNLKSYVSETDQRNLGLIKNLKNPYTMDIAEVIDEVSGSIIPTDRLKDLNAQYFNKIDNVKDIQLQSWYRTRRGLQAIVVAGDTGVPRFDIFFDKIMEELADKGVEFINLARALFIKRPDPPEELASPEKMDEAEINMDAIAVWDYIIARIKHSPENGGLNDDPDEEYYKNLYNEDFIKSDEEFSYHTLQGRDKIKRFYKHLHQKFLTDKYPGLNEELLNEVIKYTEVMAGLSVGYIPWLLRGATRSHGLALAGMRKQDFSDELFACQPFAASHYTRERYGDSIENETSEDYLFYNEEIIEKIFPKDEKAKISWAKFIAKGAELFRKYTWGEIPSWVQDLRNIIDVSGKNRNVPENKINLNESMLPLPGEIVINLLKIENESRQLLKSNDKDVDAQILDFIERIKQLGYLDKTIIKDENGKNIPAREIIKGVGLKKLKGLTLDQYTNVAFPAMGSMFEKFWQVPPDTYISASEIKENFKLWIDKIIGKAKLIPGRHWLLFGPMTMRFIQMQMDYGGAATERSKVKEQIAVLVNELFQAGGVPPIVKEYVGNKLLMPEYRSREIIASFSKTEVDENGVAKIIKNHRQLTSRMVIAPSYLIRNKDIIDAKIYKDWKFKHTRRFIHGLESGMKFVPSILGDVVGLRKRDADGYAIDTSRFWKGKAEKDTSNNASR